MIPYNYANFPLNKWQKKRKSVKTVEFGRWAADKCWTLTKGHCHVWLWGLLGPTLQLLDGAAVIRKVTQHQYEQQCFSSHVHLQSSMSLSRSSCLSASPLWLPSVCLAVTQSAMCMLRTLHNGLLSLHSRSKGTIQHRKIAPFWFRLLYHHIVISDSSIRRLHSRCFIICFTIPLHVENQTEQMGNDQMFAVVYNRPG